MRLLLFHWIIFCCVFIQYASSHTFKTLFITSSFSLPGYSPSTILNYQLKLQTNPTTNLLLGCMKHKLSNPVNDNFFVITLGNPVNGSTESKVFIDNNVNLNIGNGGPIPLLLMFGTAKTILWDDFALNYTNFEPSIKYSNGTDVDVPECHGTLLKDLTTFCFQHSDSVLGCADDASTVPYTGHTSTITDTTPTVSNTLSTPKTISSSISPLPTTTNNPVSTSTTLLPPNPIIINCTDPTSSLNSIYCNLTNDEIIPTSGNISSITNATIQAINATKMSPEEIYAVAYILEQCSLITNLTQKDFTGMAQLFDTIMLAPEESYQNANDYSNAANSLILTLNRMMTNSPSDVKYLEGSNIALLGKSLNCQSNTDAGGITDLGNSFTENLSHEKFEASIFINSETVCTAQATRLYYTIYRNSKFFVGDNEKGNGIISTYKINKVSKSFTTSSKMFGSTTSKKVLDSPRNCQRGFHQTDGRVISATALKGTQKGFENIHNFEINKDPKVMVSIKYSEEYIGTPLHGKLRISWWDHSFNQWSPQTCSVKKESNYYISECSHLTDFTLLVDGTSLDPIFCNTALQTLNYFFAIGSIFGLSILCLIYLTMIIPKASNLRISRTIFKIIPISDISLISMVYTFILLMFYFNFTVFTDQRHTTGPNGCVAVAVISYWLLMSCIILSLFNSWRIIKEHVKGTTMDKFFGRITVAKVIYPVTFLISTLLALIFGVATSGDFFFRNDSLCWVRPDYRLAIIIPFTILGLSAIICVLIMTIRRFPILEKYFAINRVKTINRPNSPNIKTRLFVLFLTQFNLGAPWLLQYFTLFSPEATVWHYLFVIFNGSQGIVIFIAFIYRCYMEAKLRKVKEETINEWKKQPRIQIINNNNNNLQNPQIIKEHSGIGRHETIKIDENCIQAISRAPSQVKDREGEGQRGNISARNFGVRNIQESQNGNVRNGYLNVDGNLQPDRIRIESINFDNNSMIQSEVESINNQNNPKMKNQNHLSPPPPAAAVGNKARHTSEGYLADTSQDEDDSNSVKVSPNYYCTNNESAVNLPDVVPKKQSKDLLKFEYIIDRVGSRVVRVYKDPDHSHFYNDGPPPT